MSGVVKRSVAIRGHRTSISLEQLFIDELEAIAQARGITFSALVADVDETRPRTTNLSSALRLHVLHHLKQGSR